MSRKTTINPSAAVLWASAFIIGALVITQAGRLPGNPAYAEMSSVINGVTILTSSSGRGPDAAPYELIWVIDTRDEAVLVYEMENAANRQILLREGGSLRTLFELGRR